jgi:hypothetical protein
MRTRLPVRCVIHSAQKIAAIVSSLVLLAERSATAQTTNLYSSGAVRPGVPNLWQQRRSAAIREKTDFVSAAAAKDGFKAQTRASLSESGAHYRLWRLSNTNASDTDTARLNAQNHRVMEVGSGMNYWDGQKWTASDPSFEVSPEGDAFVANRLCYKVRLQADNLNIPGAIFLTRPFSLSWLSRLWIMITTAIGWCPTRKFRMAGTTGSISITKMAALTA